MLKNMMESEEPFGGKLVLFGGDFRQIPPITKGPTVATVEASLRSSALWPTLTKLQLSRNMRAAGQPRWFTEFLISVGNGTQAKNKDSQITLPDNFISSGDLLTEIFGNDCLAVDDIHKRAILCPFNKDSALMNEAILEKVPGDEAVYYSEDTALCEEDNDTYPSEFLNSLNPSGMPPHVLRLKPLTVVMLLRNLNVSEGLCNGTRMVVKQLLRYTAKCTTVMKNMETAIPRITLTEADTDMPFRLKRRQLPIKLCYCMTINKSQGQSFDKVGVYLPRPVFEHGQLYVALSRCCKVDGLKVLTKDISKLTKNVVINELL